MYFDSLKEKNPTDKASSVREYSIADNKTSKDLHFGVPVDHVAFENGPE